MITEMAQAGKESAIFNLDDATAIFKKFATNGNYEAAGWLEDDFIKDIEVSFKRLGYPTLVLTYDIKIMWA